MATSATGGLLHSRTELSPRKPRLPLQKVQRILDRQHRLAERKLSGSLVEVIEMPCSSTRSLTQTQHEVQKMQMHGA